MATIENKKIKLQRKTNSSYRQISPVSNAYITSYNNDKTTNMLEEMQEIANKYIAPNAEYWNNTYPTTLYINEYSYMCTADSTICILTPIADQNKLYVYVNYDGGISDAWMYSIYTFDSTTPMKYILGAEMNLCPLGYDLVVISKSSLESDTLYSYKALLYGYPSGSEALVNAKSNGISLFETITGGEYYTLGKCPAGFLLSYINSSNKLVIKLCSYLYDNIDFNSNSTIYKNVVWEEFYQSSTNILNTHYMYIKYSKKADIIFVGIQGASSFDIYVYDIKRTNFTVYVEEYGSTNLTIDGICVGCVEAFNEVYFLFTNGSVICPSVKTFTASNTVQFKMNYNNVLDVGEYYPYIMGTKYKLFFIDNNGNVKYSYNSRFANGNNSYQTIAMMDSTTYQMLRIFSPLGLSQFYSDENNKGIVGIINMDAGTIRCINTYIAPAV